MKRTPALEAAAVAVAVAVVVGALAWPAPAAPSSWWIGGSYNDHPSIAWTFDFVARRLASGQLPWGRSGAIEHPTGATLFPADLPEAVLLAPITLAAGAIAATNLLALLHHALAAGATFGWLRREGSSEAGALAGALGVAFCAALVTGTYDGNPDVTPLWLVPAALAVAVGGGADAGRAGRPWLAGLIAGLGGWANPYVGVIGAIAVPGRLLAAGRRRDAAIALAVVLALGVGLVSLQTAALHDPTAAIEKGPSADLMGVASVIGLVRPWPDVVRTDAVWEAPRVATGAYLGLSAIALAVVGAVRPTSSTTTPADVARRRFGWALVALGVVLALGPELVLVEPVRGPPGSPPASGGTGIPLPWALAARIPGLAELHLTARFTELAALGLAPLVAAGADALGRWRWWAVLAVAVDVFALSGAGGLLAAAPVWDDGACELLAGLPDGPVLDLPPTFHELWMQEQLCHRRPVAEGINRPLTKDVRRALERSGPQGAPRALVGLGYRYLVVHEDLADRQYDDVVQVLQRCRVAGNHQVDVYELSCAVR